MSPAVAPRGHSAPSVYESVEGGGSVMLQQWHRCPRAVLSTLEYPRDLPLFWPYICTWLFMVMGSGSA